MLKNKRVMNKKGFELGWQFLFNLIFIIAIVIILVVWINAQATGMAMKKQILAKEICILTTNACSATTIAVEHDKEITIEKKDSGIIVKEGSLNPGYFYPCYLKDNIQFLAKGNVTIIEIK